MAGGSRCLLLKGLFSIEIGSGSAMRASDMGLRAGRGSEAGAKKEVSPQVQAVSSAKYIALQKKKKKINKARFHTGTLDSYKTQTLTLL